ncbi:hypothetical protein [Streptosporangium sp. NPDC051022]|uniref:hypothetical protein n=1 Tax=Streptosporangium sp. NPDC051022 TaxID=3155752 RepID=UPI0034378C49
MNAPRRTALDMLTSRASSDDMIEELATAFLDRLAHEHPKPGEGEDWYCLNLTSFMGERMGGVLVRLREAETEVNRLRTELASVQQDATKWRRIEFEIERAADHGASDAQDLLATANGEN